jgi:hypothetical protein
MAVKILFIFFQILFLLLLAKNKKIETDSGK